MRLFDELLFLALNWVERVKRKENKENLKKISKNC